MIFTLIFGLQFALAAAGNFFANPVLQSEAPGAFATQKESLSVLKKIAETADGERRSFLEEISNSPGLLARIRNFSAANKVERISTLRAVFAVEVKALGIQAPELLIEDGATRGPAFFDFDPTKPGPGKVILNPLELEKLEHPLAALSLLIHETRHSAQFQQAFQKDDLLSRGYRAAFLAQKKLKGFSFCDFTTLLNEYEAFQFANFVLGELTGFRVDIIDMGSFASQYDLLGNLKIDLLKLDPERLVEEFNEKEKEQYRLLGGKN